MSKRKNGNGQTADPMVDVLKAILAELQALKTETQGLRAETQGLRAETRAGFSELRARFDHLLDFAGDRYRGHEERIRALETKTGLKSG